MKAINTKTGAVVEDGAELVDHNGEKATLLYPTRVNETGRDGKVYVERSNGFKQEYYARVFDLEVRAD